MMKVSDAFGGIGSLAISAVPVFENTKATWGKRLITFSTPSCMACDCVSDVLGMRNACMVMFFSSSVGMNSWPSRVNPTSASGKQHDRGGDDRRAVRDHASAGAAGSRA